MKKILKGTAAVVGIALAFAGLIVCMCDTPDVKGQLRTIITGTAMLAAGAGIAYLSAKESWEKNYGQIR